jgi:hypothetical protein
MLHRSITRPLFCFEQVSIIAAGQTNGRAARASLLSDSICDPSSWFLNGSTWYQTALTMPLAMAYLVNSAVVCSPRLRMIDVL